MTRPDLGSSAPPIGSTPGRRLPRILAGANVPSGGGRKRPGCRSAGCNTSSADRYTRYGLSWTPGGNHAGNRLKPSRFPPDLPRGLRSRRRVGGSGWTAAAVTVAIIATIVWRNPAARRPGISAIAVLPFRNLESDAGEEWFSDGMTESRTSELARARNLRVISWSSAMSYRNTRKTLKQIGEELGVDVVVEGSVLRVGERVRIRAQLIRTSTGATLWGRDFDRDLKDALSLHRDVAQAIAGEIAATVAPEASRP